MRISDWSSDVCSSDLCARRRSGRGEHQRAVALVDLDRLTVLDLALQDQVGERVLQIFLYRALQRPRAIDGIIADAAEPCARGVRQEIGRASCRERVCKSV